MLKIIFCADGHHVSDFHVLDYVDSVFYEYDFAGRKDMEVKVSNELILHAFTLRLLEKKFPGHGEAYAKAIKEASIALYKACADYALSKGIIIADTKFEFGLDENGNVVIGDEMLTPDSSRFWPKEGYEPGKSQPSYDKQFVRDWLKANPDSGYTLPQDVIDKTIAKYEEAYTLLTGKPME